MQQPAPQRPGATQGPGPLSPLERTVLTVMLEGDACAGLRAQLARATAVSRTHSGVGFVTRIDVPDEVPAVPEAATPRPRAVYAEHPRLKERAEFLLQLRGGRLAVLEAYCVEGSWPADETEFRVVG
ncbi:MAG: hypothetical protein OEW88_11585 [Gammaproteobacteria bacterium]|nr:hypothetical protein [Gammaproteobacteria bacterium]MDH5277056.1 hypothetical protein [Gammaproteobacteria bacterium]